MKERKKVKFESEFVESEREEEDHADDGCVSPAASGVDSADERKQHWKSRNKESGKEDPVSEFEVLGGEEFEELKPIRCVPEWIENAEPVSADLAVDKVPISAVEGLDCKIVNLLKQEGITHFFPVQKVVIPELLRDLRKPFPLVQPRDMCVSAATGSGKTLCYVLPIVQALTMPASADCSVRALVMLPVKELAVQVFGVFQKFCVGSGLRVALMTGLSDLRSEAAALYERRLDGSVVCRADIVVATPGRLLDHLHMRNTAFLLERLRYLVIDEADRMMAEMKLDFLPELEDAIYGAKRTPTEQRPRPGMVSFRRLSAIKLPLQKILLSATLSHDPERLQQWNLFLPKLFSSAGSSIGGPHEEEDGVVEQVVFPAELREAYAIVVPNQRPLVFHQLLLQNREQWKRVLCFTNSRRSSHRLALLLRLLGNEGVKEFSSDLPSHKRDRILRQLKTGSVRVVVASDILARGVDVLDVDCVVSYEPSRQFKAYVHRVGRTARAGHAGTALTLLSEEEAGPFLSMLQAAGHSQEKLRQLDKIPEAVLQSFVDEYKASLQKLSTLLQEEQAAMALKRKKKLKHRKTTSKPDTPLLQ